MPLHLGVWMLRRYGIFLASLLLLIQSAQPLAAQSQPEERVRQIILQALAPYKEKDLLSLLSVGGGTEMPPAMLAHLFYLKRHFDKAAFFFMVDIERRPSNAASYSNLAGLLVELNAADPKTYPDELLEWADFLSHVAVLMEPDEPDHKNTRSFVLMAMAEKATDRLKKIQLENESMNQALQAVLSAPDRAEYWATMARIADRVGAKKEADMALQHVRKAEPDGPAYYVTALRLGRVPAAPPDDLGRSSENGKNGPQCNVDFKCNEICPPSIIGRINYVTCMMENETQQANCEAGKEYATAYDCTEEFPTLFAIPGLSSIASFCIPGFCVHVRLTNRNRIDVRMEGTFAAGPLAAYLGADAHFDNKNGYSVDRFTKGIKVNLVNRSLMNQVINRTTGASIAELKYGSIADRPARLQGVSLNHAIISF